MTQRNKYGVRTDAKGIESRTADNIVFDSVHEKQAYLQFRALERSGAIAKLELQVPFVIHSNAAGSALAPDSDLSSRRMPQPICKYIADFVVTEKDGTQRVYDAKGYGKNAVYLLKKKFVEAEYGIRIVEI